MSVPPQFRIEYFTHQYGRVPILVGKTAISDFTYGFDGQRFKLYGYYPGLMNGEIQAVSTTLSDIFRQIDDEVKHQLSLKNKNYKTLNDYLNPKSLKYYKFKGMPHFNYVHEQIFKPYVEKAIQKVKDSRITQSKEKQEQKNKDYTPEKSKQHLEQQITDFEHNKQLQQIYREGGKERRQKDLEYNPELFKQHQEQLRKQPQETQETIKILQHLNKYPYRSDFKLYGLYHSTPDKLIEAIKQVEPLNQFNIKEAKKKYHLKVCSKIKYSFIGDIFFQSNKFAYLLLINVNTRKAYYHFLGNNYKPTQEIINADTGEVIKTFEHSTVSKKDVNTMIKAFDEILKQTKINILEFDGEKSIKSIEFQNYLKRKGITFKPLQPGSHTSTGVMDRLCKTIRDIAFNMGADGIDNELMNKIIKIYNAAPHKTLTKILYDVNKKYGISPNDVEESERLETLFVERCLKYNALIKSQDDYYLNKNDKVRIYNKNLSDKVFEGTLNKTNKRSVLSKDIYIVKGYKGNLIELIGPHKEIIYKPRRDLQLIF